MISRFEILISFTLFFFFFFSRAVACTICPTFGSVGAGYRFREALFERLLATLRHDMPPGLYASL